MRMTGPVTVPLLVLALLGTGALLGACSGDSAAERMARATQYVDTGELRSATIELKNVLQDQPENSQAWFALGRISLTNGEYADAAHQFRSAQKYGTAPEQVDALLAQSLIGAGQFEQALEVLKPDAADNAEARAQIQVLRGRAYLGLDDAAHAGQAFDAALAAKPGDAAALVGQARLAMAANNDEHAQELVTRVTTAEPTYGRAWVVAGNLAFRNGRCEDAINAFAHIESLHDNALPPALAFHARAQAAHCQLKLGQLQQAAANIDVLMKVGPKHPYANYLKGLQAYLNKNYDVATTHVQQALAAAPGNVSSLILLGTVKAAQGDLKGAQLQFTEAVTNAPDNLKARQLLASIYTRRGLPEQAVRVLRETLGTHGNNPLVLAQLGEASVRAGERDQGLKYLQTSARYAVGNTNMQLALAREMAAAGSADSALTLLGQTQADSDDDALKVQLMQIGLYLRDGQSDKAIAATQALVQAHPDELQYVRLLARVYSTVGDQVKARETLQNALAVAPDNADLRIDLGELAAAQGEHEQADAIFTAVREAHPDNLRAVLALARSAARQGHAEQTIRWLEKAAEMQPDNVGIQVDLVRAYLAHEQPGQALTVAQRLVADAPDNGRLHWLQAVALAAAGQEKAALESMKTAVELAPDELKIHFDLVRMLIAQNELVSATSELRQIREQHPDSVQAAVMLARTLAKQGQWQAALATADSLRRGGAHVAASYALKGELLQAQKEYEAAVAAYTKAYAAQPVRELAMRLFNARQAGDLPQPEQSLVAWLEQHPNDATVTATLAQWYQVTGDYEGAAEHYRALLKDHPSSAFALNNLALVYLHQGDDRALELAQQAHEIAPQNAAIGDTLGWILVNTGNVDKGLPLLRKAAEAAPQPAMQYHLAVALARTDNSDNRAEAAAILKKLLASEQSFPERSEAEQLLQEIGK